MDQRPPDPAERHECEAESSCARDERVWRVLLVEDCPDHQRRLMQILRSAGAEVTLECNGQAALDRLASSQSDENGFDLIVTDLQMSVLDGIEMVRRLRKKDHTIPIVMCNAETERTVQQLALDAGCDSVLSKTAAHEDLVKQLRRFAGNGLAQTVDPTESSSEYGLKDDTKSKKEDNGLST